MKTDQEQVQLMKRRGGVGHDLSHIRPKGSQVKNSALTSTGLVPFMERFSNSLLQEGPTIARAMIENGSTAVDALEYELNAGNSRIERSSQNLARGLITGYRSRNTEIQSASRDVFRTLHNSFRQEAEENSPSRVFVRSGENIVQGLINGLDNLQHQPSERLRDVVTQMLREVQSTPSQFTQIGQQIMQGLNQGLLMGEGQVMQTANRIANNIARTMRQALQINSPSRVMREQIGRHIPGGIAAGIDKYSDVAMGSIDKLANQMIKINIPSIESMIGYRPMNLAGAGGYGNHTMSNQVINHNNYDRLFEGANIHWHNAEDIRSTMEKIAWATEREKSRMW
jgi:phage-related protein